MTAVGRSSGHVVVGFAGEDEAHGVLVTTLARRAAVEQVDWLDDETLEHMWRWLGPRGDNDFRLSQDLELRRPGGRPIRLNSRIHGEPLRPEARMYRRILLAFEQLSPRPEIVIIARDGDGRADERRGGFEQIIEGLSWSFAAILAMPEPESEAWFIGGFEPTDESERARHGELLRGGLNFNPVTEPHRLTSQPNDAPTDAKRVAAALLGDKHDRRNACLEMPLATLAERGKLAGLARFIADLRRILVPLVDPSKGSRN